jgi:hypothetical protein
VVADTPSALENDRIAELNCGNRFWGEGGVFLRVGQKLARKIVLWIGREFVFNQKKL